MGRSFIEVSVTGAPGLIDVLTGLLTQIGFEGFWEEETTLRCYVREDRWSPAMETEVARMVALAARSSTESTPTVQVRTVPDRNWNEEWEKTITPIRVTDHIVITPSWHTHVAGPGDLVLTIDPKMSFGTGYHETTRLVLRMLEEHLRPGMHVLDIGTGTGILAIAAVRLGASSAVGIDTDEWSYDNARENAAINGVSDRITIVHGELPGQPVETFDLVLANVQRDVLIDLLPHMVRRLAPAALLVLSGLLTADRTPMLDALRSARLTPVDELTEGEWIALAARC